MVSQVSVQKRMSNKRTLWNLDLAMTSCMISLCDFLRPSSCGTNNYV